MYQYSLYISVFKTDGQDDHWHDPHERLQTRSQRRARVEASLHQLKDTVQTLIHNMDQCQNLIRTPTPPLTSRTSTPKYVSNRT